MKKKPTSTYAIGRRGGASVVDTIVHHLRRQAKAWPERSFGELRAFVSTALGYDVRDSTIRSAIYSRADLFEKALRDDGGVVWRLSEKARQEQA